MENALTTIKNIHDSIVFQLQIDNLLFGDIVILLNEDGVETEVLLENLTEDLANHFAGFAIPLQGKNHLVTNILLSLSKEDLIQDSFEKAQEDALKELEALEVEEYLEEHFSPETDEEKTTLLKKLTSEKDFMLKKFGMLTFG